MAERVALGEIANNDGDEGKAQGASDGDEGVVMRPLPRQVGDSFQELEYCALENP
jgi:hypothetical protein